MKKSRLNNFVNNGGGSVLGVVWSYNAIIMIRSDELDTRLTDANGLRSYQKRKTKRKLAISGKTFVSESDKY